MGRTPWTELDGRHIQAKSQVQLAGYPDACFLFRMPEARDGRRHLPLTADMLDTEWFRLLEALELRLADLNEAHQNGMPIRFLPATYVRAKRSSKGDAGTLFPLHNRQGSIDRALA